MLDHRWRSEVWSVAKGVTISDHYDVVIKRNRGPDGRIDAEVSSPTRDQHAVWRELSQGVFERSSNEWIV